MKNRINEFYLFKVWSLTVITAPILLYVLFYFDFKSQVTGSELMGFMIIFILAGALYTIPTLLISYLIFFIIKDRIISLVRLKVILIFVVTVLLMITNYLIWGKYKYDIHFDDSGLMSTLAYCLAVLIFGVWCTIKLPPLLPNVSSQNN